MRVDQFVVRDGFHESAGFLPVLVFFRLENLIKLIGNVAARKIPGAKFLPSAPQDDRCAQIRKPPVGPLPQGSGETGC